MLHGFFNTTDGSPECVYMTASRKSASSPHPEWCPRGHLGFNYVSFLFSWRKTKFEAREAAEGLVSGARVASSAGCWNVCWDEPASLCRWCGRTAALWSWCSRRWWRAGWSSATTTGLTRDPTCTTSTRWRTAKARRVWLRRLSTRVHVRVLAGEPGVWTYLVWRLPGPKLLPEEHADQRDANCHPVPLPDLAEPERARVQPDPPGLPQVCFSSCYRALQQEARLRVVAGGRAGVMSRSGSLMATIPWKLILLVV